MFPADTLQLQYLEARERDDAAKKLARLQEQHQKAEAAAVSAALKQHETSASRSASTRPAHLMLPQQHPAFVRPSSGLLGNIFQGLSQARASSANGSPAASGASTPSNYHSPLATPLKVLSQSEMEALIAEKRRDADICAMPAWYH